jgi:NADH-quinone oxidoreductase subunit J
MNILFLNLIIWILIFLSGLSAMFVFINKNPVHSVLSLISAFFFSSILILINDSEFLSMIIITVYVGAVAVLFLFIVMMIDIDHLKNDKFKLSIILPYSIMCALLFMIIFSIFNSEIKNNDFNKINFSIINSFLTIEENNLSSKRIFDIANIIYNTEHVFSLIIISFILLASVISVICMSLKEKSGLKKQNSINQNMRNKSDTLEIKKVNFNSGVDDE